MAKVGVEGQRFGSGAGFGRHHKQGTRRIQAGGSARYPRRNCAVQREHLRIAGAAAEGLPDDLRPQAAAAHPQQDDMAVAGSARFLPETRQGLRGLGHILRQGKPGQAVGDFIRAVGPKGMVAGFKAGWHGGGVQPGQHSGHRIVMFPQQVAVGHCNHPCGPGPVDRDRWAGLDGAILAYIANRDTGRPLPRWRNPASGRRLESGAPAGKIRARRPENRLNWDGDFLRPGISPTRHQIQPDIRSNRASIRRRPGYAATHRAGCGRRAFRP